MGLLLGLFVVLSLEWVEEVLVVELGVLSVEELVCVEVVCG